jgi:sugar lactone lactonase YvrE
MTNIIEILHTHETVSEYSCLLGEAPLWHAAHQAIVWIDITSHMIYFHYLKDNYTKKIVSPFPIGSIVPRQTGGYIAATQAGLISLSDEGEWGEMIAPFMVSQPIEINDGKCDPQGRYWSGFKSQDFISAISPLYCIDQDHNIHLKLSDAVISNGLAWNKTGTKMYYIDTPTQYVDVFDFNADTAQLSHRTHFIDFHSIKGLPDGMTIDEEDHLWIALWDGGEVQRYTPQGRLAARIILPVDRVTSCCFGGPALKDLFITTANEGLTSAQKAQQPLAGCLFKISLPVGGLPAYSYRG